MGPFSLAILLDGINNSLLQLEGCDPKRLSGLALRAPDLCLFQ
jgi:hypothetical protein